jgi:hypothetical protein
MTAEQNEMLENERVAERLLAQIAAEVYRSPEAPQAALLGHTKPSYVRVSLGGGNTFQHLPTGYCGTETTPVELAGPQEERTVTPTADPESVPEPGPDPDNLLVTGSSQPKDDHGNVEADNNAKIPAPQAPFSSASQQPHLTPSLTRKRKRGN